MMLELPFLQASGCCVLYAATCMRHHAKNCLQPHQPPLRSSRPQFDVCVVPRDRPSDSDDQWLSTTTTTVGHLDLTLPASDALAMVALVAVKSAIFASRTTTSPSSLAPSSCSWTPSGPRSFEIEIQR
jgi:hypothetical protein